MNASLPLRRRGGTSHKGEAGGLGSAELLAPAGDMDALRAAVKAGADAVYLGYTRFSARASASNFDEDGLRAAIDLCHEQGVRVHVAVNTLIAPSEWDEAVGVLEFLCRAGADAVIIQDIGLMDAARRFLPDMPVHASTQMTIHNRAGAEWLKRHGASRAIAARECAAAALASMAEVIDVEAFAHGAMCVSVSGQCLFSSFVGGRSGNRGACAQPCRLRYEWNGVSGALLSPRDQAQLNNLRLLILAGVSSFKIEGRMKRPSYVYNATRVYREALDRVKAGLPAEPDDAAKRTLRQTFHRGGFCTGYVGGAEDAGIIYPDYAGHEGVPVGKVRSVRAGIAEVTTFADLNHGDTLRVGESAFPYNGDAAAAGRLIRMKLPDNARDGDTVYRQIDASLERNAEEAELPTIPVDMAFRAMPGERARLTVSDGSLSVTVETDEPVQRAERRATDAVTIRAQLSKIGGTAYAAEAIEIDSVDAHLPLSLLNGLRAKALDGLRAARIEAARPRYCFANSLPVEHSNTECKPGKRLIVARYSDAESGGVLLNAGADAFEWSPTDMRLNALDEQARLLPKGGCAFVFPEFLSDGELDGLFGWFDSHRGLFDSVVISNPGQLEYRWGVPVHIDAAVHAFNAHTARVLFEDGGSRVTLSPELTFQQIRLIASEGEPLDIHAYGRERLMLLSHCPARTACGLTSGRSNCAMCEQGCGAHGTALTDGKGVRFPLSRVRTDGYCRLRVLNSVPTDLSRAAGFCDLPVSWRLMFWDETLEETRAIVRRFRELMDTGEAVNDGSSQYTTGHARRPV